MLPRPLANIEPQLAPPGTPIPRTANEPSTMIKEPTAKNPIARIAGATFGKMWRTMIDAFEVPIDFDASTNSRPAHCRADARPIRPRIGITTSVRESMSTPTLRDVVVGLFSSEYASTERSANDKTRLGIDNITLNAIVTIRS